MEEEENKDKHNQEEDVREAVECWDEVAEAPDDVTA